MFLNLNTTGFTGYANDIAPSVVRDKTNNVIKTLEEID